MNQKHACCSVRTFTTGVVGGVLAALAAAPAHAHHAMGGQTPDTLFQGFLSGLAHPVIGLDHFAFLVVIALLAFSLHSTARYIVPLAFVLATVGGTAAHLSAAELPLAEVVVALSVLLGGLTVLLRRDGSGLALGAIFALFGIFHGYAYGESIVGAESTPLLAYVAGFALIQYGLIFAGIRGLDALARRSELPQKLAARIGGGLATLTGGVFLAMSLA